MHRRVVRTEGRVPHSLVTSSDVMRKKKRRDPGSTRVEWLNLELATGSSAKKKKKMGEGLIQKVWRIPGWRERGINLSMRPFWAGAWVMAQATCHEASPAQNQTKREMNFWCLSWGAADAREHGWRGESELQPHEGRDIRSTNQSALGKETIRKQTPLLQDLFLFLQSPPRRHKYISQKILIDYP